MRNDTVISKIAQVAKTTELWDEGRAIAKNLSVQSLDKTWMLLSPSNDSERMQVLKKAIKIIIHNV